MKTKRQREWRKKEKIQTDKNRRPFQKVFNKISIFYRINFILKKIAKKKA